MKFNVEIEFTYELCFNCYIRLTVQNLRTNGTYGGNDALVAFARYHRVNIYIHQIGFPVWTVSRSV